jgi:hypothetical protein
VLRLLLLGRINQLLHKLREVVVETGWVVLVAAGTCFWDGNLQGKPHSNI